MPITWNNLVQLSPTVRQQLKAGLADVRPGYEIRQINQVQNQREGEDRTPAYTQCQIEDKLAEAIIDTGQASA